MDGYRIDGAAVGDIPGILDLQECNLRRNGGALSVPLSREWIEDALTKMPVLVARSGGRIVGYVVSSSLADQSDDPVLNGMLRVYPAGPGAYVYGPICVAESERGRGLARALFTALRARLPGRDGFTFIRGDNMVSRAVHARMGLDEAAAFSVAGIDYVVVAYRG